MGLLDLILSGGRQAAQPARTAAPPPPPQEPGALQGVLRKLTGGGGGGNILSALGPALATLDPRNAALGQNLLQVNMDKQDRAAELAQQNETAQWLQGKGLDPESAAYLASDPDALRAWYKDQYTPKEENWTKTTINTPEGVMDVLINDQGDVKPVEGAVAKPAGAEGGGKRSLTPQFGTRDGKPVMLQLNDQGGVEEVPLPEGVELSAKPIRMDVGTHYILLDPVTRQQIGQPIPKNIAETEVEKAIGGDAGAAEVALPGVESAAKHMTENLDILETHPGREGSTGFWQGALASRTEDQTDFIARAEQIQGGTFLEAYQKLKGAGAITESEAPKAEAALSRLRNYRVGDAAYVQAIKDLKQIVKEGVENYKKRASKRKSSYSNPPPSVDTDIGPPPPGVDPETWKFMTPEGREAFR